MEGKFDFVTHLQQQREWSYNTFGPGVRTNAIIDHIKSELLEIEAQPLDLEEWIDVIMLASGGALRTGATPEAITEMLAFKLDKNQNRRWPDWRTSDPDSAIYHLKELS